MCLEYILLRAKIIKSLSNFLLFFGDDFLFIEAVVKKCFLIKFCESNIAVFGCNVCLSCRLVLSNLHPKICYFTLTSNTSAAEISGLLNSSKNVCWCISNIHLLDKSVIPIFLQFFRKPFTEQLIILLSSNALLTSPLLISECQVIHIGSDAEFKNSDQSLLNEVGAKFDEMLVGLLKRSQYNLYIYFRTILKAERDLSDNGNYQLIFNYLLFSKLTNNYLNLRNI